MGPDQERAYNSTYDDVVPEALLLGEGGGLLGMLQLADCLANVRLVTKLLQKGERVGQSLFPFTRHFPSTTETHHMQN